MPLSTLDLPATTEPGRVRVAQCGSRELVRVASQLLAEPWLWWASVRFEQEERYYRRIAATERYEAWLLTWLPGQGTGLHDHGGASGAFAVARGSLTETTVAVRQDRAHPVSRELTAGRVRGFGPEHVHDVANTSGSRAISLHVYAPALSTMRRYARVDDRLVQVSHESAGRDW
jgi:cysteine dioxygenase type I